MTGLESESAPSAPSFELTPIMYSYDDPLDSDPPLSDSHALLAGRRTPAPLLPERKASPLVTRRAFYIRALALLCAMSLSIGSH